MEDVDVREVIEKLSLGGRGIFRKLWREYRMTVRLYTTVSCTFLQSCLMVVVMFMCVLSQPHVAGKFGRNLI